MTNDELMTRRRAEDCPPYRYRPAYVDLSLVGRVTPCAPPRVIRHSDFEFLNLAFHIPNGRESRHWLADSRQLSRRDHFIDIFVSRPGFFGEARP